MANEWFCKLAGTEIGPLSPQQLKAMAVKGRLTPEDEVRRGKDGAWNPAGAVAGLFPKADSSAAWADTAEIPVEAAKKPPAAKPAAKSKPAAARAVRPVDLPVAKAAPQPPPVGGAAVMPVATPVDPVARPRAVTSASKATPVGAAGHVGRGGHRAGADPVDFKRRKKERQKKLVFGLVGLVGALAISGIVVAIVRSNSSDAPAVSADDKTVAQKTPAEDLEGYGIPPGAHSPTAIVAKTSAETPKAEPTKPAPAERPAKADDGWHDARGPAIACGDMSVRIASATIVTRSATHTVPSPSPKVPAKVTRVSKEYLQLKFELANNHDTKKIEYVTWNYPRSSTTPILTDNFNNKYDLLPPATLQKGESIYPGKSIEETVVFQRPIDLSKLKFLRLRLPAAAFGGQGTVDFEIPAAMIVPEPEKEKPGTHPKGTDDPLGLGGETPAQPKTSEKEPPAKKDSEGRTIPDLEKDIEATGGGDRSRT